MDYLIGVDIGTSGTKTVLFDAAGNTVASCTEEYPLYQPQIGWAEQEPEDWWKAVYLTISGVLNKSGVNPEDVRGIGLSGQMHGLVLLDGEGRVIRRSIIWCDQRTQAECKQITEAVGPVRLAQLTGNPAVTGFTASKILWVKNHEPENYARAVKILLPKDYIRYKLTGVFATEVSDASGTQLLDITKRDWSEEVLERLGVERSLLPKVYESHEISGGVSKSASAFCGLKEDTPVAGGAGDQAACAVGNGVVGSGLASSTIGSSGVVFASTSAPKSDPAGRVHTFCHAVPGMWHVMGVTQGAGLSLKWFRDNFCQEECRQAERQGVDPYQLMDAEAAEAKAGADGLIFLPYMMGERTPHLDPDAKGVFFGISAKHTKKDMIRAVMEGVAYSLRDCFEIIRNMGISISEMRVSGGGGNSPLWRQMQADMFHMPVTTINSKQGGALGAAILAGVGAGLYPSVRDAANRMIRATGSQAPIEDSSRRYDEFYKIYTALYRDLKEEYQKLAQLL